MTTATRRCPHCGAPNDAWRRTCEDCGESLTQPADEQDYGATRPFIPTRTSRDDDDQRTAAFQPTAEPRQWNDAERWDAPSWQSSPARDAPDATTSLPPQRTTPEPTGHGIVLGCIALLLIGLVAAAVLWLTYIGPEIPDFLSP
jgi:hypothetical protein